METDTAVGPHGSSYDSWSICIKNKMSEGHSFDTSQDMCWHIVEGASAKPLEIAEVGNRFFAKFFLINTKTNARNWRVTEASIPKRLASFIGRPYGVEPNMEHFGAENMDIATILMEQENYRKGTIVHTPYNPRTGEAFAVVEVTDDQEKQALRETKDIYVSPGVAGFPQYEGNEKVYHDWVGLHLMRVKNPAYGVMSASLKQTCEGTEKVCMQQLIATANANIMRFNTEITNSYNAPKKRCTASMAAEEKKVEELTKEIERLKTEVSNKEKLNKELTDKVAAASKTDEEKKKLVDTAAEKDKKIEELTTKVANIENETKTKLATEIANLKVEAELIKEADKPGEIERLVKMDLAALNSYHTDQKSVLEILKTLKKESASAKKDKAISLVASASGDKAKFDSIDDIRHLLPGGA